MLFNFNTLLILSTLVSHATFICSLYITIKNDLRHKIQMKNVVLNNLQEKILRF